MVVLISVVSVLGSRLGSGITFLSFLFLFTIIVAIATSFIDPPAERT